MLPDRVLNEIAEQTGLHFQNYNPKLIKAAQKLLDAGWTWDEIRPLLSDVYGAGGDQAREDAAYESGCCGCEHS